MNVEFQDNVSGLYANGTAHMSTTHNYWHYLVSATTTAYGIELDSTTAAVNSSYLDSNVITCLNSNKTGLYIHGNFIADLFISRLETAVCDIGVNIVSTDNDSTYNYNNGDVRINEPIIDQIQVAGIRVTDVYGGGTPGIDIRGGHFHSGQASAISLDIVNSQGVQLSDAQVSMTGATSIGVKMAGANTANNRIIGNKFDMVTVGVQIASPSNIVSNNTFTSIATQVATTNISYLSGALLNTAVGNTMTGYATTGIIYASGANNNQACANTIDTTNITTDITNSGTGNTPTCEGGGSSSDLAPVNSPADLWPMNEGAGNNFNDLSGLSNTAAAGGTVTWSAGPGTCFVCAHFDGSFDTLSANHTRFDPDTGDPFSVSAWVSFDTLTTDSAVVVAQLGTGNRGWFLFRNGNGAGMGQANRWVVGLQDNGAATAATAVFGDAVSAATMYHVVWTVSDATVGGMKLYVNGVEETIFATLQNDLSGSMQTGQSVYLGSWTAGTTQRNIGYQAGTSLYNRVLTQAEVSALYAAGPLSTLWVSAGGGLNVAVGKTLTVSNSVTLAGTDGTTMTFPATSATMARTDAANTFTGTQTFTAPVLGTPASVTLTNATGLPTAGLVDGAVTAAKLAPADFTTGTSKTFSLNSGYFECTSTCTITMPVPVAGMQYCVRNANNTSTVITFAAIGSSAMYENTASTAYGTAGTGTLVSGGAIGDKICLVGKDSTHYDVFSFSGTWTVN